MSHYRDERNPEAVHFPARLYVLASYGALAMLIAASVVLILLFDTPQQTPQDLLLMTGCLAALAMAWPRQITTDQHGVRQNGRLGIGKRFIAWTDVRSVREIAEIPLLPRRLFGCVQNHVVVVRGPQGVAPIRFTSRHSAKDTFLHELERWGVSGI